MDLPNSDILARRIKLFNWAVIFTLLGVALLTLPVSWGKSFFIGGVLGVANFHTLARAIKRALSLEERQAKRYLMVSYYLRLVGIIFVLYLLVTTETVEIPALVAGLSVNLFVILGFALYQISTSGVLKQLKAKQQG